MESYAAYDPNNGILYIVETNAEPLPTMIDVTEALTTYPTLGPGWTTPDGGTTWVAPSADSMLAAQAAGQTAVQSLAASIAAQLEQATADAETIATWAATQTVFPPNVMAAFERAGPAGWVSLLQGIGSWLNATYSTVGLATPASTTPGS